MRLFLPVLAIFIAVSRHVEAGTPRGVFAHFMVGNTVNFTGQDWTMNMNKAASAGIQAFALNMAADWPSNEKALDLAFPAAVASGFKLFFSFDYPGGRYPWDKDVVIRYLKKWGSSPAYWQHAPGKPLASTFEGPDNAADWITIKAQTNCFFMPDWSSKGAFPAVGLAGGVADGLFSWAAWPYGARKTDTYTDHSYRQALAGKPYMMPVSPWFFTNLPGYDKNWLWRGGNLWYERWQQVFEIQPEYVQIISWNDFGESHYVGPLDDKQYEAFLPENGNAPFNFVKNPDLDHTGWLIHLPFLIKRYMTGTAQFTKESAVVSHHLTWTQSCKGGGTTGNTASQLQLELAPESVSVDRLHVAALLTAPASFYVSVAGKAKYVQVAATAWDIVPDGGIGMYYTSVPMSGPVEHTITIERAGAVLKDIKTTVQGTCFAGNMANWNARVTSSEWTNGFAAKSWSPTLTRTQQVCIQGWGEGNFNEVCAFVCKHGYCPDSCVCENMGQQRIPPKPTYDVGYSKNGDANYDGICNFACNLGTCPTNACSLKKSDPYIPASSPFTPDTCTSGTGSGDYTEACQYTCKYGFCPRNVCSCSARGPLVIPPPVTNFAVKPQIFKQLNDAGLCNFSCARGQCALVCNEVLQGESVPLSDDAFDFDWVKSYLAMGDSFAAGIGVGAVRPEADAAKCGRYTGAYPAKIQEAIKAKEFVFTACSGDLAEDVYTTQERKLQRSQLFNLITVSAGGNDVGFSDVLKACLFLPSSVARCVDALNAAESKIDVVLEPAVNQVLDILQARLTYTGIAVWTLYAKFFDESPLPCNKQQWCFTVGMPCLTLTVELRQQFNRLVGKTNQKIADTIDAWKKKKGMDRVRYAHWSGHVIASDGQFCEPDSASNYNDASNSKLAFIRPSVDVPPLDWKRDLTQNMADNDTLTTTKRDTSDIIPDELLANFHPNFLGTNYQAAVALGVIDQARRDYFKKDNDAEMAMCPWNPPAETPPPPAYKPGTCGIHVKQWDDCKDETEDLTCEVLLVDDAKTQIGHAERGPCNANSPMVFNSKLPNPIVISGQHQGDYVQFQYGAFGWPSNDKVRCSVGGWDPRGSLCGTFNNNEAQKREMDCIFPC